MKIKIIQEGQACRKCSTPVIKRTHTKDNPVGKEKKYWFEYWFECPHCHTLYMVNSAKRYDRPPSSPSPQERLI